MNPEWSENYNIYVLTKSQYKERISGEKEQKITQREKCITISVQTEVFSFLASPSDIFTSCSTRLYFLKDKEED